MKQPKSDRCLALSVTHSSLWVELLDVSKLFLGFLYVFTWICQNYCEDFSQLLLGFVNFDTWISQKEMDGELSLSWFLHNDNNFRAWSIICWCISFSFDPSDQNQVYLLRIMYLTLNWDKSKPIFRSILSTSIWQLLSRANWKKESTTAKFRRFHDLFHHSDYTTAFIPSVRGLWRLGWRTRLPILVMLQWLHAAESRL